uniref:DegT/DnrJ/EryC1/StrS family aminotransferase n=1 Tax=Polynucleobacter sp. TaxID=2029855 RepID=UPI004048A32E
MIYFSHARTAFKYGLIKLGIKAGDKVLIPNYICDALLQPIRQLALVPIYFPVNDLLEPQWNVMESLVKTNLCRAIIMVHYFGQPQNIESYVIFCRAHNLLLLEDNAHGFGGTINGKLLGTYGDLGISSPRKILNTLSGGILYINGEVHEPTLLPTYRINYLEKFLRNNIKQWPKLKFFVQRSTKRLPNFHDPNLFIEPSVYDQIADIKSADAISDAIMCCSYRMIADERRKKWVAWSDICTHMGLKPVYSKVHPESSPWAFPAYVLSEAQRIRLIEIAIKRGLIIFPWPALPKELLYANSISVKRWGSIICIPLL